jgi:hypothetical protein
MNSFSTASDDNSALPVCFENAWKSLTEPGSVAYSQHLARHVRQRLLGAQDGQRQLRPWHQAPCRTAYKSSQIQLFSIKL